MIHQPSGKSVKANYATLLLTIGDDIRLGRTSPTGGTGMADQPDIQRPLSTLEAIDRVAPVKGLGPRESGHDSYSGLGREKRASSSGRTRAGLSRASIS